MPKKSAISSAKPPSSGLGQKSDKKSAKGQPGGKAAAKAAAKNGGESDEGGDRPRLGLRGAAPWAARHAKKHAAEAAARNAEPPRPGSARATLRQPEEAERIKARIGELHNLTVKIRGMKKALNNNFYEIGQVLAQIREQKLYDAKGYTSLEAFAERELDLGKALSLNLARIPSLFFRNAALEHGLEALVAALTAIDEAAGKGAKLGPTVGRSPLPLKPPTR